VYLLNQRIVAPSGPEVGFDLLLARSRLGRVVPFRDANATVPEKNRDSIERHTCEKQFDRERIAEAARMPVGTFANSKRRCKRRCHFPFALRTVDAPVQKKYRSLERGAVSNASATASGKTQYTGTPVFRAGRSSPGRSSFAISSAPQWSSQTERSYASFRKEFNVDAWAAWQPYGVPI
jgi:hypothetical protein